MSLTIPGIAGEETARLKSILAAIQAFVQQTMLTPMGWPVAAQDVALIGGVSTYWTGWQGNAAVPCDRIRERAVVIRGVTEAVRRDGYAIADLTLASLATGLYASILLTVTLNQDLLQLNAWNATIEPAQMVDRAGASKTDVAMLIPWQFLTIVRVADSTEIAGV